MALEFTVDGRAVSVGDESGSLLEVLRDRLGVRSPKDGCSPQGQCGCCTVWIDGAPRVACVTPARRAAGRTVTTVDGLAEEVRHRWADAFCATGASQCGFCTPGIIMRLAAARQEPEQALLAHLCRCTGWQPILEALPLALRASAPNRGTGGDAAGDPHPPPPGGDRDLDAAERRALLEGGVPQRVSPDVALGRGGFADDLAPTDALVAVPDGAGGWAVGETLTEARAAAGKVQGRRTTLDLRWPVAVPDGDWSRTLQTTWTEPAYLETDASWCLPGGQPADPVANGGAFGGKASSIAPSAARELADRYGRAVRVLLSREDTVRLGAKRPPMGIGTSKERMAVAAVRTAGLADRVVEELARADVTEVDVAGPPTSLAIRGAGWLEPLVVAAAVEGRPTVQAPSGGTAEAEWDGSRLRIRVSCGDPLDEVVLRSYCVGAAHQALGLVRSEGIAVDDEGVAHDLTVRSFGILRAVDMPAVEVEVDDTVGEPANGSDAVLAAVALAAWRADDFAPRWPTRPARSARS
jgi:xanthine dehydrogenase small subunit